MLAPRRLIHVAGLVTFAAGSALGLTLVYACGWPVLMLGLIGAFGSYFYTAEPLSLAYHGLGDFMVFALMGPGYVLGGYYVQALNFTWASALVGVSMGLLCSSLLQVNNLRDIENDLFSLEQALLYDKAGAKSVWRLPVVDVGAFNEVVVVVDEVGSGLQKHRSQTAAATYFGNERLAPA
jgi:1,4-dihydroxy-2-naphthoate polyprenyltransferase